MTGCLKRIVRRSKVTCSTVRVVWNILKMAGDCAQSLRRLPMRVSPARLATALRVAASVECAQGGRGGLSLRDRVHLAFRNMMRPVAVPAMGGIFQRSWSSA